jgi:hypothetical protein
LQGDTRSAPVEICEALQQGKRFGKADDVRARPSHYWHLIEDAGPGIRNGLIGSRPVAVATAEDAVLDPAERIGPQRRIAKPLENFAALSGGWPL